MPTGQIHIVLNLGDPYYIYNTEYLVKMPNIVVASQFKKAQKFFYGRHVYQIGIAIRPSAFSMFFGIASSLFTEIYADENTVVCLKNLDTTIKKIDSAEKRIEEFQNFFVQRINVDKYEQVFDEMIDYMESQDGDISLLIMAKNFGYSISALERNFKRNLGLTPKAFANLILLKAAKDIQTNCLRRFMKIQL